MKKLHVFHILLLCFCMAWVGCEKTDQTTTSNVALNGQLITREEVGACDQCPENDCCCGFELLNSSNSILFRFCGTAEGAGSCSPPSTPPSPCSSMSGGGQSKTLGLSDPKLLFCMVKGNSLAVTNTSIYSAVIRLTCQYSITNPYTANDVIPAGETHYYLINSDCEANECEP